METSLYLSSCIRSQIRLVPPQDVHALASAIADVVANPSLADELRRKGLERARQFSWERTAEQTIEVYRSVAA